MHSETAAIAARLSAMPHEIASNDKRQTETCGAFNLALHRNTSHHVAPSDFCLVSRRTR
jgi:hypothetical protein